LASDLLAQAELRWGEVERIAVGVGPGTFTGLRIGVATARGLAQSLGVDVVAVGTLRVLAQAAIAARAVRDTGRDVLAAIDARRGEVFVAAYTRQGEELAAPRALAPEGVVGLAAEIGAGRRWLAVGDGAIRFRVQLEAVDVAVAVEGSPLHRVDAGVLCELALTASRGAPEAVLPDYRRRPDAEIALENAEQ
jgi:tRNA threonylcarbamoyladenosine biosynthesis protein TsaB